jgi:cytoskeletal protein CcmA (bactofilin family)
MATLTTPPRGENATLSIIASGTVITGDIVADGVVKIEGEVNGNVQAGQQVLVSRGGTIRGDVRTRQAVVGGTVAGSVVADERVEVQSTASIEGDVATQRLVVMEGGRINGGLEMRVPSA